MANVLDFLFEGKPPQSVTTYGQTIEGIPKWMSDYTQGLIARANAAAAEPYIPYGGPRIAGFDPAQEAAFGMTEEMMGAYQPYLERGARGIMGGLRRASRIGRAAAPYLEEAAQTFPGAVEEYMDPYVEHVLQRQEDLATRTLEEQFLPGLQRAFAGAGQLGSRGGVGSMEQIGVEGVRDIAEDLEKQRLATLSGAYGQAGELFGADAARMADIARIRGALEEAGAQQMFAGAQELGRYGEAAQRLGLGDIAAMEAMGAQRRGLTQTGLDLAYQDFLEQRDLPWERLGRMHELIRGLPYTRATTRTDVGPAQVYQPSPLQQLIGAYGAGRGLGLWGAEGGYVDEPEYAEGGYVDGEYDALDDYGHEQGYQFGGLARGAGALMEFMRGVPGRFTDWAKSLYPNPGRSVGVAGGKFMHIDKKQD